MRIVILLFALFHTHLTFCQAPTSAENYILKLLARDSITSTTIYFIPPIKFGLSWKGHSYIALAKENNNQLFILAGTQQVYTLNHSGNALIRKDSSYHFGDNYNCMTFLFKDTLYQYGGYGFWQNRDFFTRYDKATNQWEYIQGGELMGNRLTLSYLDRKHADFYVFGQLYQNTSIDFNAEFRDSIYRYNLNSKTWDCLGKIRQEWIKEMYPKADMASSTFYTPWGLCVTSPVSGKIHLFDFTNNRVVPMKRTTFDSIASHFRAVQHNLNNPSHFHLHLKDTLHYIAMDNENFSHVRIKINQDAFDFSSAIPMYIPIKAARKNKSIISFTKNQLFSFLAVLFIFLFFLIYGLRFLKIKKTQRIHHVDLKANPEPLKYREKFLSSLSEVERGFLNTLIEYSGNNKKMPTDLINRLLGVSHKDYESQKVRRSHVINRINENYRFMFETDQTLIRKEKNEHDRRAFDYFIPIELIKSVT